MAGYAFKYKGEEFDLYENQEVTFTEESALISEATLPGVLSLPAFLPPTKKNKRLLGNLQNLQFWDYKTEHTGVALYLMGSLRALGKIVLNDVDETGFEFSFLEFDASSGFADKKVSDLNFPVFNCSFDRSDKNAPFPPFISEIETRNNTFATSSDPLRDFVAPVVYNPSAEGVLYKQFSGFFNIVQKTNFQNLYAFNGFGTRFWQNNYTSSSGTITLSAYPIGGISLFPFLRYLLDKIFSSVNLSITYSRLDQGELANLIVYSARINCIHNVLCRSEAGSFQDNSLTDGTARLYEDDFKLAEYVPYVSILDFLKAIKKLFNLVYLKGSEVGTIEIHAKADVIKSLKEFEISDKTEDYKSWVNESIKTTQNISYDNPEVKPEKTLLYKGSVPDLASLPSIINATLGDSYFVVSMGGLFAFDGTSFVPFLMMLLLGYTDILYYAASDLQNEITQLGVKLPEAASERIHNDIYGSEFYDGPFPNPNNIWLKFFAPQVTHPLTTKKAVIDETISDNGYTTDIYLMFYRGIGHLGYNAIYNPNDKGFPESGDFNYPFAAADKSAPDGLGPFSETLNMHGPDGIFEKWHKPWLDAIGKTRKVIFNLRPTAEVVKKTNNSILRFNSQRFIPAKLTIKATPKKITTCQVESYQIMK